MKEFIQELRKASQAVFIATNEAVANDISLKLTKSAKLIEQMSQREKMCPTMQESESRALLKALQEIAESVGLDTTNTPRETVEAVHSLVLNS